MREQSARRIPGGFAFEVANTPLDAETVRFNAVTGRGRKAKVTEYPRRRGVTLALLVGGIPGTAGSATPTPNGGTASRRPCGRMTGRRYPPPLAPRDFVELAERSGANLITLPQCGKYRWTNVVLEIMDRRGAIRS
jgi:hypothetical protein